MAHHQNNSDRFWLAFTFGCFVYLLVQRVDVLIGYAGFIQEEQVRQGQAETLIAGGKVTTASGKRLHYSDIVTSEVELLPWQTHLGEIAIAFLGARFVYEILNYKRKKYSL